MLSSRSGVFHPDFFYHPRPVVEAAQTTLVEIYEPTGETIEWMPGQTTVDNTLRLAWKGRARVQPNKDWRARARNFGQEADVTHAVRVQIAIGRNEQGATYDVAGKITAYGPDPKFAKDFVVICKESAVTGTSELMGIHLTVRNAINSTNLWQYNLLCDGPAK